MTRLMANESELLITGSALLKTCGTWANFDYSLRKLAGQKVQMYCGIVIVALYFQGWGQTHAANSRMREKTKTCG